MCIFCRSLFVIFLLAIVLSVLLPYTDSDYLFGIFKLFLSHVHILYSDSIGEKWQCQVQHDKKTESRPGLPVCQKIIIVQQMSSLGRNCMKQHEKHFKQDMI